MSDDENLNQSVILLLEHSQLLQDIQENIKKEEDLNEKLQKLKTQITEGITKDNVVPEMLSIVEEISSIQKELQIHKLEQQHNVKQYDNDIELVSDWIIIESNDNKEKEKSLIKQLTCKYAQTCKIINCIRKPVKPIFVVLQYLITVYTTGIFSIIPISLRLLSQ